MDPILIVDDENDNLEALRRLLRDHYDISVAVSPVEGLKLVMTRPFHVIVSDQRMPDMTGVEFFEKVKNVQPSAIRILLTGYADLESVVGAINRGQVYRYIAKPWDPEDLKITLRQANESFKVHQELEERNRELSKANLELATANRELQRLDCAKARFLSLVSHELNTPLTVLTSFVPLLSEKGKTDAGKAVKAIESASERLSEIVQEIVSYVSVESNPKLQLETVNLAELIKDSLNNLKKLLSEKALKTDVRLEPNWSTTLDRTRFSLALKKLMSDFVSKAPQGSSVRLTGSAADSALLISRAGDPLSENAFEPLEFSSDPLKHQKSLGLGLALCRSVVEAHGGSIRAFSTKEFPANVEIKIPSKQ